jgi:hypothetical protein
MVLVGDSADAADDWIAEYISAADVWVAHNDRVMLRDRKFADSSLEGDGFELPVPLTPEPVTVDWSGGSG